MTEKKKTNKEAKIIPIQPKSENHQNTTEKPVKADSKSSQVFFDALLQIDEMLSAHFQNSTQEKKEK